MENTEHIQPMGAIDLLSQREAKGRDKEGSASHGDVVVEALSGPVRILIAGVVLANLSLGAWFVSRSDFSTVRPQSSAGETHLEAQVPEQSHAASTSPDQTLSDLSAQLAAVAVNERN